MIEAAGALLERMNMRSEMAAQNIANITTPGYKSRVPFFDMLDNSVADSHVNGLAKQGRDWSDGKLVNSDNPLDLAISGDGFFVLRSGDAYYYTRSGRFTRDADGHLISSTGLILQGAGGDIVATNASVAIDPDGTVHDGPNADQQIAIHDVHDKSALSDAGDGLFLANAATTHQLASPDIHQGALEASNVSDGAEMTSIMISLRGAESAQRIVQLYDDLLSQAAGSFGQGAG